MNNIIEYKNYKGTVEYSPEDDILHGKVLGINSLISYEGHSIQELKDDFKCAVDDYLESCTEFGIEPEKSYKGCVNVRLTATTHRDACIIAAAEHISLNQFIENSVKSSIANYNN